MAEQEALGSVEPSLRRSWSIQRRVIWALLLREIMTRYGRHNIGFLWLFVEPMLFTLGVTALWTATQSAHGSNLPIVAFAITGYSSVLLWRIYTYRDCSLKGQAQQCRLCFYRCSLVSWAGFKCPKTFCRLLRLG
jgi:hypothetical protein